MQCKYVATIMASSIMELIYLPSTDQSQEQPQTCPMKVVYQQL